MVDDVTSTGTTTGPLTDNGFADVGYRYSHSGGPKTGRFANGVELQMDDVTRHDLMNDFGYRF